MTLALAPIGRFAFGRLWRKPAAARSAPSPRPAVADDPEATRDVLMEMMQRETERAQAELEMLMLMAGSMRDR